jgi:hypothetical protein
MRLNGRQTARSSPLPAIVRLAVFKRMGICTAFLTNRVFQHPRTRAMEPVRIRDDVDPNSPRYRRELIIVTGIVLFLTLAGGTCLGYRIRSMESAGGSEAAQKSPAQTNPPVKQMGTEQPE